MPAAPYPRWATARKSPGASGAEHSVNPPGRSGGVREIACPAGQGSSGESVPRDGPARGASPKPRLRNDGGLVSYADGMAPTLGRIDAYSTGFAPIVPLDKSGVPLFRSRLSPCCATARQAELCPIWIMDFRTSTSGYSKKTGEVETFVTKPLISPGAGQACFECDVFDMYFCRSRLFQFVFERVLSSRIVHGEMFGRYVFD